MLAHDYVSRCNTNLNNTMCNYIESTCVSQLAKRKQSNTHFSLYHLEG